LLRSEETAAAFREFSMMTGDQSTVSTIQFLSGLREQCECFMRQEEGWEREREKAERERAEKEGVGKEKAEKEGEGKEKAEKEGEGKEKAEKEGEGKEGWEKEKADKEKAEKEGDEKDRDQYHHEKNQSTKQEDNEKVKLHQDAIISDSRSSDRENANINNNNNNSASSNSPVLRGNVESVSSTLTVNQERFKHSQSTTTTTTGAQTATTKKSQNEASTLVSTLVRPSRRRVSTHRSVDSDEENSLEFVDDMIGEGSAEVLNKSGILNSLMI
jgi:hypothetical protein